MTRRHRGDEVEANPFGRQPSTDYEDLPMFTSTERGLAARDEAAAKHTRDIERLVPIARELAAKAGASGVTVSDLRIVAVQRSVLTGEETGRQLSYLGKVMEAAGLERTGRYRRSDVLRSHGNLAVVWRAPECPVSRDSVSGAA